MIMKKTTYKTIDLFGNEQVHLINKVKDNKKTLFTDYDGFIEKFEIKKTTDDCYTPENVFKVVLDYVQTLTDISGLQIIRPFYPGGDYEAVNYPDDCIVIDNPPFSIIGFSFLLSTSMKPDLKPPTVVSSALPLFGFANVVTSLLDMIFGL